MNYSDVVVIGGGIVGLSSAWRIAQRGARVTLIEKRKIGCGASGAALGVLAPPSPLKQSFYHTLHRTSLAKCTQFFAELQAITNSNLRHSRCGMLELLHTEDQRNTAEREAEVSEREQHGGIGELRILDAGEAPQTEICDSEFGAAYCTSSAVIDVTAALHALTAACKRCGVRIVEDTPVQSLCVEGNIITGVAARNERYIAAKVLAAAGTWTAELAPEFEMYTEMRPIKGQALLLETHEALLRTVVRSRGFYLVPWSETLVAAGSTTEPAAGFDENNTVPGVQRLLRRAAEIMPALKKARLKKIWTGLRPGTIDGKPYLGPIPGVDGLYVASGHYKTGIGFAPLTAEIMADLVTTGSSLIDIHALHPRRDKALI